MTSPDPEKRAPPDEDAANGHRAALGARPGAPRGAARSAWSPRWAPSTTATCRCCARAREECDVVVVSLFVNPSQFDERADLERYPRDEARDAQLAARPARTSCSRPRPRRSTPRASRRASGGGPERAVRGRGARRGRISGASPRSSTKLLCMALPDVAYFGRKDAQQLLVIRRLVGDLNLPVRIEAMATVREPDGLALSSRNALLSAEQRAGALGLPRRAGAARGARARGRALRRRRCSRRRARCWAPRAGARVRRTRRPRHLAPLQELTERPAAGAARVGAVRLIDNEIVGPGPASRSTWTEVATAARLGGVNPRPDRSPPCQATPPSEHPPTRCGCR